MTARSEFLPWPPAASDADSRRRDDIVQLGVWMFLATVVMLFAAFGSAYIIRRSGSDWTPIHLPGILWANTAVLVASSVLLESARRASQRDAAAGARRGLAGAIVLALAFLAGQVGAWRTLQAQGVYVPTSPHASFFYVLTAAHGIHVVAGLVLLVCAAVRPTARLIGASSTFWHFLAVLWLYVFGLVWLV